MLYFDIDSRGQTSKRVVNMLPVEKTARPTDKADVFEVTLSVQGRTVPYPAPLYVVFVFEKDAPRRDEAMAAILIYLEILFGPDYADIKKYVLILTGGTPPVFSQSLPELAAWLTAASVCGGKLAEARELLGNAPVGAHKAIVLLSGGTGDGAEQVREARAARDAGIVVRAVADIAAAADFPAYLHEVDSGNSACHLPPHQDAPLELAVLLLEFTQTVLRANNNIMLADYIVRRPAGEEHGNDGTFTLDTDSLEVAYLRRPGDTPQFTPVELQSSPQAALTLRENFSVLNFSLGHLWPEDMVAEQTERFCRALLRYRLLVNPGVHSGDTAQPLPTNFTATVDWTELGEPLVQLFPVSSVYVPPCGEGADKAWPCPCYPCRSCYPCHPCQPCWAGCSEEQRPLNWGSCLNLSGRKDKDKE